MTGVNLPWKKFIQDKIRENRSIFLTHKEFEQSIKNIISDPQSMLHCLKYTVKGGNKKQPFHVYEFGSKKLKKNNSSKGY